MFVTFLGTADSLLHTWPQIPSRLTSCGATLPTLSRVAYQALCLPPPSLAQSQTHLLVLMPTACHTPTAGRAVWGILPSTEVSVLIT